MVTEYELKSRFSKMLNVDLIEVVSDKTSYTELAYNLAVEELNRRNIEFKKVIQYAPFTREIDDATKKNCLVDLEFLLKLLYFYLLWVPPLWRLYKPQFMANGYILKDNQSNYYSVCGFISLVVLIIITNALYYNSIVLFFVAWAALFLITYLFDINFNRERQIKNIRKAVEKGEIPWGF